MPEPQKGQCRSCGAAIRWVRMAGSHKVMPLDAEPVEHGNVRLDALGLAHVHGGGPLDKPPGFGPWYVSHFATCPHAAQHRRQR